LTAGPATITSCGMSDTQIDAMAEAPKPPQKAKEKSETADFMWFLLKLGIFVFVLRSFIVAPFSIPSESMMPRLLVGDYLLVSKWPYGYSRYSLPFGLPLIPDRLLAKEPKRGDVVVFKWPQDRETDYIKRVIGLPGDLVEMRNGQLILNGKPIPKQRLANLVMPVTPNSPCLRTEFLETGSDGEARCSYPRFRETLPNGKSYNVLDLGMIDQDNTEVFSVPEGHLFLMGDNRDNSADSRFSTSDGRGIGLVPQELLVGKALVSVFSTDGSASWLLPWTWFSAARWDRIGQGF
jgi:signal peptidase I